MKEVHLALGLEAATASYEGDKTTLAEISAGASVTAAGKADIYMNN